LAALSLLRRRSWRHSGKREIDVNTTTIIVIVLVAAAIVAAAVFFIRRCRSHALDEYGDQRKAEAELGAP